MPGAQVAAELVDLLLRQRRLPPALGVGLLGAGQLVRRSHRDAPPSGPGRPGPLPAGLVRRHISAAIRAAWTTRRPACRRRPTSTARARWYCATVKVSTRSILSMLRSRDIATPSTAATCSCARWALSRAARRSRPVEPEIIESPAAGTWSRARPCPRDPRPSCSRPDRRSPRYSHRSCRRAAEPARARPSDRPRPLVAGPGRSGRARRAAPAAGPGAAGCCLRGWPGGRRRAGKPPAGRRLSRWWAAPRRRGGRARQLWGPPRPPRRRRPSPARSRLLTEEPALETRLGDPDRAADPDGVELAGPHQGVGLVLSDSHDPADVFHQEDVSSCPQRLQVRSRVGVGDHLGHLGGVLLPAHPRAHAAPSAKLGHVSPEELVAAPLTFLGAELALRIRLGLEVAQALGADHLPPLLGGELGPSMGREGGTGHFRLSIRHGSSELRSIAERR